MGGLTNSALLVNLGAPDSIAPGMRADTLAATGAQVRYVSLPDTYHFAFLAECSPLGWAVIALAGDDNISADHGTRDRAEVHAELTEIIGGFLQGRLFPRRSGRAAPQGLDVTGKPP
ncbi:hypothetical protein [Sedimentitalea arenosa]|uniref:Uncharacterized protein n=1 Tax=Sedimentitalea arenosa TaxID=2798803 RepID=A0A8J7J3H1_9RHOB|nr:hypothetical protein [Arenibacterium arenosum]MBJ6372970.1 hypothetical protein [Arenibacterium arenosum]